MTIGGVMIFGGSLRFAERRAIKMGGLVMSADTVCANHRVGSDVRHALNLHTEPVNVVLKVTDHIILNIEGGIRVSGSKHCT